MNTDMINTIEGIRRDLECGTGAGADALRAMVIAYLPEWNKPIPIADYIDRLLRCPETQHDQLRFTCSNWVADAGISGFGFAGAELIRSEMAEDPVVRRICEDRFAGQLLRGDYRALAFVAKCIAQAGELVRTS